MSLFEREDKSERRPTSETRLRTCGHCKEKFEARIYRDNVTTYVSNICPKCKAHFDKCQREGKTPF